MTLEVFHYLHQKFRYVGAAWYTQTVELSKDLKNSEEVLSLERVMRKTSVWVNGQAAGSQNPLCTPPLFRRFAAEARQKRDCRRVDNRMLVDIGVQGHSYTNETQTWSTSNCR